MTITPADNRTEQQRAYDEARASEPKLLIPEVQADVKPVAVEALLSRARKPIAVAGVVENGVVRPIDPSVRLSERSRVIIIMNEAV